MQTLAKLPTTRPSSERRDLEGRRPQQQRPVGSGHASCGSWGPPPARVKARGALVEMLDCACASCSCVGLVVACAFLGPDAVDDRGPLRGAGQRPLPGRQYAQALAEGHPFQYNPGEAPTTGATSLLHTTILALAHAAGARGEGLIAFAILLGAALYLASLALAVRIGDAARRAARGPAGRRRSWRSAVPWSGASSTAPTSRCSCSWPCGCSTAGWRSRAAAPRAGWRVAGALLALARPEGLPIAGALALAGLWRAPAATRRAAVAVACRWRPGSASLALQRAFTGTWLCDLRRRQVAAAELRARRDARAASQVRRGRDARPAARALPARRRRSASRAARPPSSFRRSPCCWSCCAVARTGARSPGPRACGSRLVAVVFALVGPNVFMGVHFNRYLMWAFPGLLALRRGGPLAS